ncbi:hypothetical protein VCHA53O466_50226 [Vibrio chagasii]|nr:hypothetical protein VCHA53O466_50226 [Vibrio chagasii]
MICNDSKLHACWWLIGNVLAEHGKEISVDSMHLILIHNELALLGESGSPMYLYSLFTVNEHTQSCSILNEALEGKYDTFNLMFEINDGTIKITDDGLFNLKCENYDQNPFAVAGMSSIFFRNFLKERMPLYLKNDWDELRSLNLNYLNCSNEDLTISEVAKLGNFDSSVEENLEEIISASGFMRVLGG